MTNYDEDYTLYKTENGQRRLWRIVREGDKHKTFAGLEHGAITESQFTVSKGKNYGKINATTGAEQASLDIAAKIRRQREKGYSDDGTLPAMVGGQSWKSPTLAHKFKDRKHKVRYPAFVSPKLDGIRCVINKDGMWSRNGKPFVSCPHIFAAVRHLFDARPDLVIDGELYNHSLKEDFDKICSLVKKSKPTPADIAETARIVQYWVFDIDSKDGKTFAERYVSYKHMFKDMSMVRAVHNAIVQDEAGVIERSTRFIKEGFEGGMIRSHDAPYVNKRTDDLLKYKLFIDEDFEIVGIEEGQGNRSGMMGRINFKMPNGKLFDASAQGTHAFFTRVWLERDSIIGLKGTVRYQNLTPNGIPRFPVCVAIRDYE